MQSMNKAFNFLHRVVKFFKNYLLKNPVFTVAYAFAYFAPNFSFRAKFYRNDEFKNKIKEGKSLIRIGDGEIHIMNGGSISYQKYENKIDKVLMSSIKDYSHDCNYVLAINERVINKSNSHLKKVGQFSLWLPMKVYYFLYFKKDLDYFDASAFYYKDSFENIFHEHFKGKKLIINTLDKNIKAQKENIEKHFEVLEWIPSQEPNPFDLYESTKNKIRKIIDENANKKDLVFILGCGPMSKVLAYDFCSEVQCLDVGIGFEIAYTEKDMSSILKI